MELTVDLHRLPTTVDSCCSSLRLDPRRASNWLDLATALKRESTRTGAVATIGDRSYRWNEALVRALEIDEDYGPAWYNLGILLPPDEAVRVKGTMYNRIGCLQQCLRVGDLDQAWCALGMCLLGRSAPATVKGKTQTRVDCFTRALELNPHISAAWFHLALELRDARDAATVSSQKVDRQTCLVRALENDPAAAEYWYALAVHLREAGGTADVGLTRGLNANRCCVECLEIAPTHSHAWILLAQFLSSGTSGATAAVGGEAMNARQCLHRAVECPDDDARAWLSLALDLAPTETIIVRRLAFDRPSCIAHAIETDDSVAEAWYNLGVCLIDGATVSVKGVRCSAKDCFKRAVEVGPSLALAWHNLSAVMGPGEKVVIRGTTYTAESCSAKYKSLQEEL